jgi:predicted small lipoprotein YifL
MRRALRSLTVIVAIGALSACGLFHHKEADKSAADSGANVPPPESINSSRSRLKALEANQDLAARVPDAINAAERALKDAEHMHRDREHAQRLARIADMRVSIAEKLADASRAEEEYKTLAVKRDARRGGNETVMTLAPLIPTAPASVPTPLPADAVSYVPPPPPPKRQPEAKQQSAGLGNSYGWLGVDLPPPASSTADSSAAGPVAPPLMPPLPAATALPGGRGAANTVLWLPGTEFNAHHDLTGFGRQAVHAILPTVIKRADSQVLIFSSNPANIEAVRKELTANGIAELRMRQAAGDMRGVEVDLLPPVH